MYRKIYEKISDKRIFAYHGYFAIVLLKILPNHYDIVQCILNDCWNLHIPNAVVVAPSRNNRNNDNSAKIYRFYPNTNEYCNKVIPAEMENFPNNSTEIFDNKMKNWHGCPLIMAAAQNEPHMILLKSKNSETNYEANGIDGSLINNLADILNFKLIVKKVSGKGFILENGTITGAFGLINNEQANFTMGEHGFSAMRIKHFSPSIPYFYTQIVFALAKNQPYSSIQQLSFPFDQKIWFCIIASISLGIIAIGLLNYATNKNCQRFVYGKNTGVPILNLFAIILAVSIQAMPKRNFARTLFCLWLFGCFVLQNSYQGALFKFMQNPKSKPPPQTIDDLLNENYTIHMAESIVYLFKNLPRVLD